MVVAAVVTEALASVALLWTRHSQDSAQARLLLRALGQLRDKVALEVGPLVSCSSAFSPVERAADLR